MRQQYGMDLWVANPSITDSAMEEQELHVETMGDRPYSTLLSRRSFLFTTTEAQLWLAYVFKRDD